MQVLESRQGYRKVLCDDAYEAMKMLLENHEVLRPLEDFSVNSDAGNGVLMEVCTYQFHDSLPKNGKRYQASKRWRR